jgi:hypothetical protein
MNDVSGFSLSLTTRRTAFTPKMMSALYGPAQKVLTGETIIALTMDG